MTEAVFKSMYLSGLCRCGKHYTGYVELPETCLVNVEGQEFEVPVAEHIVIICPFCTRVVNLGSGSYRERMAKRWSKKAEP